MITDIELCRSILFRYAEEKHYPSKIQLDNLIALYPERSDEEIIFHVVALKDAALLDTRIEVVMGADFHSLVRNNGIKGLTPHLGSEFVHHAKSDKLWKKAVKKFGDAGMEATLSRLVTVLTSMPLA